MACSANPKSGEAEIVARSSNLTLFHQMFKDSLVNRLLRVWSETCPKKGFKGQRVHSGPKLICLAVFEGVTTVDLSDVYDSIEMVDKVARMLDQLLEYFQFRRDSDNLRLPIVTEEAHQRISKDLPKDALRFLDSAARLLRRKGVGGNTVFAENQ